VDLDQRFEHVKHDHFDAVADRELVALGKFLDRRHKPRQELVVRLELSVIGAWPQKKPSRASPWTQEVKK
jgi:hypothetical protein